MKIHSCVTQIGFGDLVPTKSFFASEQGGFGGKLQVLAAVGYCVLGIAIVAMCISFIQVNIADQCSNWFHCHSFIATSAIIQIIFNEARIATIASTFNSLVQEGISQKMQKKREAEKKLKVKMGEVEVRSK